MSTTANVTRNGLTEGYSTVCVGFNTRAACFIEARIFCCARAGRDVENKRGVTTDDR